MLELYSQLNGLTILVGISVAIIQYLFINYRNDIKQLLAEFSNLEFIDSNDYEQSLKKRWEKSLIACQKHSYAIKLNWLILLFFVLIILISLFYAVWTINEILPNKFYVPIAFFTIFIAIALTILLGLSIAVLWWMKIKEQNFRYDFQDIKDKHDLAQSILNTQQ